MEKLCRLLRKIKSFFTISIIKLEYGHRIKLGKRFSCRSNLNVRIKQNGLIIIGNNVFLNNNCSLNCIDRIEIGDNCILGEGVKIYDHNHQYRQLDKPIYEQGYKALPVHIGSDCWLGSNVIILSGVKIGNHCIIGAGTVIYKDIPDYSVVKNCQILDIENIKEKSGKE